MHKPSSFIGHHIADIWPIKHMIKLECGTWYDHPRRLQSVKFSKSQRDIIDAVTVSKIIVFGIICNVAYYCVAKFTFLIEQLSNKATKMRHQGILVAVAT